MGTLNKERARAKYILTYRDAAMAAIHKEQQIIANEAINKLCMRNQSLLGCATPSFIFEGKWYAPYALPHPSEMKDWNRIIHPSLLEKIRDTLHHIDFGKRVETSVLANFFSSILIEAIHIDDVAKLIPGGFMNCLPLLDPEIFNLSNIPLPMEQIKMIEANNSAGISCLNEIAIKNLLLAKV